MFYGFDKHKLIAQQASSEMVYLHHTANELTAHHHNLITAGICSEVPMKLREVLAQPAITFNTRINALVEVRVMRVSLFSPSYNS